MRIQARCLLHVVLGLCLLGGVTAFASSNDTDINVSATTVYEDDIPTVRPLNSDPQNDASIKEIEVKIPDGKKKLTSDFKVKTEQKYQKPAKDDEVTKHVEGNSKTTTIPNPPIEMETMTISDASTESIKVNIPFLIRGEPVGNTAFTEKSVTTKEASTVPTILDVTQETKLTKEASFRGRALNITAPEPTNSLHANITDLSDVSMDDDDKEVQGGEYIAEHNETVTISMEMTSTTPKIVTCTENGKTYTVGDRVTRGCDEKCICGADGAIKNCQPLCVSPYVRASSSVSDSLCQEKVSVDEPCCATLICAVDSAVEPDETCVFGNTTVARGQKVEDGCSKVCICEAAGNLKCQSRCPPNETRAGINQHDRCVALTDPSDPCCTITLCDVTLGDHEIKTESVTDLTVNLTDVKVINSTAIQLKLSKDPQDVTMELSDDGHVWREQKPDKNGVIHNLEPARSYYVRVIESGRTGASIQVTLPAEVIKTNVPDKMDKNFCYYRGKSYKLDAIWYDECISLCSCKEGGKTSCVTIECPTDSGLDVLDPHCLDWETVPPDFQPKAPHCCPEQVRCRNNGSCNYEGKIYDNWSELPVKVIGCEKRCFCEMGNVTCHAAACPPVPAHPPAQLPCAPHQATLRNLPGDECCVQWMCNSVVSNLPGKNVTLASPGHLTTNTSNLQSIVDTVNPNNKSEIHGLYQDPAKSVHLLQNDVKNTTGSRVPNTHGSFHYPMDPGHPTIPYNGPYSPEYKPTLPSVEDVFHLTIYADKVSNMKDKVKPKSEPKKPIESFKPHKEVVESNFPGPLSLDRFKPIPPVSIHSNFDEKDQSIVSVNPNKLPPPQKGPYTEQPHFIPLAPQHEQSDPTFVTTPHNNVNNSPINYNFDKPTQSDPNVIVPAVMPSISKKKPIDPVTDKIKHSSASTPNRQKSDQRDPEQDVIPEELYHLINNHPGLSTLETDPPQGHSGIYNLHRQIVGQKPNNQIQPNYFGQQSSVSKKQKPQIYTHKNENGETTYHVHTPTVPNSPQQIEELLAHISQHDANLGPFQHYPGQPPIPHNIPNNYPSSHPLHIDAHLPQSGFTHLNHPFAAQTPNQSGLEHATGPGFPIPNRVPNYAVQSASDDVVVQILEPLDESTVRFVFVVPQVLVGLHGRVELRYTSEKMNNNPSTWKVQAFALPHDLIATQQLEFELGDLKPSTEYKVKIFVKLNDLSNSPTSKIYSVRTLDRHLEITTLPPQIPIDAELVVMETNSSWVNVMWKKFTEYELQFIDGVQLRYKEHDGKVYAATPLIHRAVTNYVIENLKPSTAYEIGIYFIPFPGQTTELISEKTIQVTTFTEPDPYSFDVKVEIKTIKSMDVEVSWSGVPYPEDKYVNIYRAIYQSDSGKEDTSTFKIAKRDSPARTIISDLKPGTRYRLWIEVYLTNGRIKKSNVQDFVTKPGVQLSGSTTQQAGKLASIPLNEGDYYGPLVVVAIVASLAILSTLILLMMLMKRRTSSKADISPRKTTSAYDNPSYKTCEDASSLTNERNKSTDHEMTVINSNAKETA